MLGKKSGLEKKCGPCGKTKSVKEFYKHRGSQDGLQTQCKACTKKYRQSERGRENQKRYSQSEKGREVNRKAYKKYDQSQKGKGAKRKYDQSQKGRETHRKAGKKYRKTEGGRQSTKKWNATRLTRKTQAGGSYTIDQWFNLCKFYNFRCLKCNKKLPFERLTLDHVKPVSKGGSSDIWNTQPLCKRCNSSKNDKEIDYRETLPDWIKRDAPIWIQDKLF